MAGDVLGDLELTIVFEVGSDAGPPEGMAAHPARIEAGRISPRLYHAEDRGAAQGAPRERFCPGHRTEERKISLLSGALVNPLAGFSVDGLLRGVPACRLHVVV